MLKRLAVFTFSMMLALLVQAQSGGTIKGKMIDKSTNEPLPFANIVVFKGGAQVGGTMTDMDGKYTISALTPGTYEIQASYVGYQPVKMSGIVVNDGKITFSDIKAGQGIDLNSFELVDYEVPLISKDQTSSGGTVSREDIAKMPGRSAASIAQTVGGVNVNEDGSYNIRGSRTSGTDTYIDGIRVRGSANLPNAAIEQVSVITGGMPAEYGDATGGIVSITTRGASKDWFGGLEYLTSGFKNGDKVIGLDSYGYNLLGFNLAGPIFTRKDSAGNKTDAIAGFFISGELKTELDDRPSSIGNYKINDEKMDELNNNPLVQIDKFGIRPSAELVTAKDIEKIKYRQNAGRKGLNLAGKIDISPTKNTTITIGGTFDYEDRNRAEGSATLRSYSLFNSANNPQFIDRSWRTYARFTKRFDNNEDKDNPSLIKNAFVSLQADYSNVLNKIQNEKHKDKLADYGYIGRYKSTRQKFYSFTGEGVLGDSNDPGNIDSFQPLDENGNLYQNVDGGDSTIFGDLSSVSTVLYTFQRDEVNPILANYVDNYYDFFAGNPVGNWERPDQIQGNGGLLNGDVPSNVYNLWASPGTVYNQYQVTDQNQLRLTASGSAEIKGHSIKIGFQFEQRVTSQYNISPIALWRTGRGLTNKHLDNRDTRTGQYTIDTLGVFPQGTLVQYDFIPYYDQDNHTQFDKNIRQKLGLAQQGLDYIDFDSYGNNLWTISDFTADDLLTTYNQNGISYYGYDYTGKKLSGNRSLDDFFTKKDANGNLLREQGAFRPIYMAGYIQDKFAFEDLIFNIGIRVDRYDANQPVLIDKHSLFPVKTVAEVGNIPGKPSNIGDDFVVYVSDAGDPSINSIVGYRDGDTWYDADGKELTDPKILGAAGVPQPWLVDSDDNSAFNDLSPKSFKDYEPQINVSPRIAFSFPISDEALFVAHYDVLTQRPSSNSSLQLLDYLLLESKSSNDRLNNPDLKAERTIDYELGFQQKINNYSSIKIAAFYREQKDMIQVEKVVAYPNDYFSYGNRDFGTVKGITFSYDMRRQKNFSMRAAYTLQFAEGTGSSSTTSLNLVSSGNGNLRTLIPLSFDQRHVIVLSADYRYGAGKSYNGPVLFGKEIFANTGANIIFRTASGTPYTKTSRIVNSSVISGSTTSPIEAGINSSRLPWQTTVDLKVDKNIDLKWGKGEGEERTKAYLNVYVQVLNLLNSKNILDVYSATGNPDDDGYLAAAEWQSQIASNTSEQAFRDLYQTKMLDPNNFSLPRRIRLGLQLNF